jgi:hypothetical protein
MLFSCYFEAIRAPPNRPKKVLKGLQVEYMYNLMYKLKNKGITKPLGPFF